MFLDRSESAIDAVYRDFHGVGRIDDFPYMKGVTLEVNNCVWEQFLTKYTNFENPDALFTDVVATG